MSTSLEELMGSPFPSQQPSQSASASQQMQMQMPPQAPQGDEERMRRILAEMNAGGASVVNIPLSGQGQDPRIINEPPVSLSTGQYRMDPVPPRANIIGGSQPTAADFHAMLQQQPPGMLTGVAPFQAHRPPGAEEMYVPREKSTWKETTAAFLKNPFAVGFIVFLLNLPVVTTILSRYASWMYLSSGEISMGGLAVKATLAACLYALYQVGTTLWE